jgi:hypothetical protein
VYGGVVGWESFEPWLGRIESMGAEKIWNIAETVPPEWYGGELEALERLVEGLIQRQPRVRELIGEFRESDRKPFPKWLGVGGKQVESGVKTGEWVEDKIKEQRVGRENGIEQTSQE